MKTRQKIASASLVSALIASAAHLWLYYLSGCAGDLKTGTGDPVEALRIAAHAFSLYLASLFLYGVALWLFSMENMLTKVFATFIGIFILMLVLWFLGFIFEAEGGASCQ